MKIKISKGMAKTGATHKGFMMLGIPILIAIIIVGLYFYFINENSNVKENLICNEGVLICSGLERLACLNNEWVRVATCDIGTECIKISDKELRCVRKEENQKITPITPIAPLCEEKILWSYCSNVKTLSWMMQRPDCSNYIKNYDCLSNEVCRFKSSSTAKCEVPAVFEPILLVPVVQKQTVEMTLISRGEPSCVVSSYRKLTTSEGYTILEVKTNPIITSGGSCRYTGWTDVRITDKTMVISTQGGNFWVVYEHEKCHLINRHIATSEKEYLTVLEPICIEAEEKVIGILGFLYKEPVIISISGWN